MEKWSTLSHGNSLKFTTPLPKKSDLDLISSPGSKVLDLGCGYGRVLDSLYKNGFRDLTGVDISYNFISQAKKICPKARYFVQDIEAISLEEKFDLILLMGVIEYIITDRRQEDFFCKVSSLLNNDGHVFLETFTFDLGSNWKNYMFGFLKTAHWGRFTNSVGIDCHHQSIGFLSNILNKYFRVVEVRKERFVTWSNNFCNGYTIILEKK